MTAADYLSKTSAVMETGYTADCVTHASALAELLLAEGAAPWIGRLREVELREAGAFHVPLIPERFRMLTWNTHYVCCAGGQVYDPIVGSPVAVDAYPAMVFGRPIPVQEHLSPDATATLLRNGGLKAAFRPTLAS